MKTIRHKVFETNSSSTHSISISNEVELLDSITPDENGQIILNGGEFGWAWEKFDDPLTKANYCAIDQKDNTNRIEMLKKVIIEQTGAKEVILSFASSYDGPNWSYIDHDSHGTSNQAFESEEILRNFIFNTKSKLYTGNDNESAPPNFYDEENIEYQYILKLKTEKPRNLDHIENVNYRPVDFSFKLKEWPNEEELKECLSNLLEKYCDSISGGYMREYKYYGSDTDSWSFSSGVYRKQFTTEFKPFTTWDKLGENKVIIFNEKGSTSLDKFSSLPKQVEQLFSDNIDRLKWTYIYSDIREIEFTITEL